MCVLVIRFPTSQRVKSMHDYKLTRHQSGNRKYHSIETLNIIKARDDRKWTPMVQIDLSRAFDSICRANLLHKLSSLGTSNRALKWFESYLTDRQQSTRVGTSLSEQGTVSHGVPQGPILGPMLFNLYMNDLSSIAEVLPC